MRYVGKLHWIIYGHSIIFGILTIALAAWALSLPKIKVSRALRCGRARGHHNHHVSPVMVRAMDHRKSVVTDKRAIYKRGFIARHTCEMNISRVETVDVDQRLWGRILIMAPYGLSAPAQASSHFRYVASPLLLRNAIIVG